MGPRRGTVIILEYDWPTASISPSADIAGEAAPVAALAKE
jgi:hypothetical protein